MLSPVDTVCDIQNDVHCIYVYTLRVKSRYSKGH